jgi:hypothetical protein
MPFELKLEPHPARCPITGDPHPGFAHTRSVRVNGHLVAYIQIDQPGRPLTFIGTYRPEFANQVKAALETELQHHIGQTSIPPQSQLGITDEEDNADD